MTVLRTLELMQTLSLTTVSPLIAEEILAHTNMDETTFLRSMNLAPDACVVFNEQTVENFCRLVTMTACLDYLESAQRELVHVALDEATCLLELYPDVLAPLEETAASFSAALDPAIDGSLRKLLDIAEEMVCVTWTPPTRTEVEEMAQRLRGQRQ